MGQFLVEFHVILAKYAFNSYLKGVNKDPLYFPPEWVYFLRPVGPREIKDMREGNIVGLY